MDIEVIEGGHVTSPQGFSAGAVAAGIKKRAGALDLGLLVSDRPATAAGVFTQIRKAGFFRPNSRTMPSSFVWRLRVCPSPPKDRISIHFAQPSRQSFTV